MFASPNSCDVKGGRIRTVCSRCKSVRYVPVSSNTRRKAVRCRCGKNTTYMVNHRGFRRETTSGVAEIFMPNGGKMNVLLNDVSSAGIGFTARSGGLRALAIGSEITLKYRSGDSQTNRKARIRNVAGNRAGAEFTDGLANLMKML
ncbi:PilZ domain-containing protein [Desulfogranum japonicum]|uniref:PilZ domain-containing protein n=1 Tax=Desulfogranum japonicum TaxID=231447 RepID=UPI000404B394|nr:PilZ domain-containing protein [Desulfogranum japonicum]